MNMIKNKMDKRGIALGYLAMIIILIISFVIILAFYSQLDFEGLSDREICHQTVLLRATVGQASGLVKDYVPLKCTEKKICVSSGLFGGECEDFGRDRYTTLKVDSEEEIEKILSDEILECWSMMGEGKVSIFSQYIASEYGLGDVYPSCVVCSRVAFDYQTLEEKGIDLSLINVEEYMKTHKRADLNESYYEMIVGKTPSGLSVDKNLRIKELDDNGGVGSEVDLEVGSFESTDSNLHKKDIAILFMQISSPDHWGSAKNSISTATGLAAGGFVASPLLVIKGGLSPLTWVTLAGFGIYQQVNIASQRALTAGYCGDLNGKGDPRAGCSFVRTVDYDAKEIGNYCYYVESSQS